MAYFIFGVIISLGLVFVLFRALVLRLRINWDNRNKSWQLYLAPVILAVLLVWTVISQVYPRLYDSLSLISSQSEMVEVTLKRENIKTFYLEIEGERYFYCPATIDWQEDSYLQINYSPKMHYIVTVNKLASLPDDTGR